jgi:hypothetical protein
VELTGLYGIEQQRCMSPSEAVRPNKCFDAVKSPS